MKFPESKLAHELLDGLKGIEIGGSAHNPFGLNTINVDRYSETDTVFKRAEMELAGEIMPVNIVAFGDDLPFKDKSFDFVISSHVIEHFYDPIRAIDEWIRVARKFVFIICPHRDRTSDKNRPITTIDELAARHLNPAADYPDKHWSVWDTTTFVEFIKWMDLKIHTIQDTDDKVGNGFTVVIEV